MGREFSRHGTEFEAIQCSDKKSYRKEITRIIKEDNTNMNL
jgi:hypothetical protein